MRKNNRRGFTLIELLVVIAIIGILSSLILTSVNTAKQKSRDVERINDVKQIQIALEYYFDKYGVYPTDAESVGVLVANGFLPTEPLDPMQGASYAYARAGGATDYCLGAAIEDPGRIPDNNNNSDCLGAGNPLDGAQIGSVAVNYTVKP
jgi:prepilin-type N-terminal cleavage/methylation domain-containing protein